MKDLQKKPINWAKVGRKFLFYLGGVLVGAILVWAFWWRKRTDLPSLWPKGIVKDKIVNSTFELNDNNTCYLECLKMSDSIALRTIDKGEVLFSKSKPRRKPYPVYAIKTRVDDGNIMLWYVESRDSTINLMHVETPGLDANVCNCEKITF